MKTKIQIKSIWGNFLFEFETEKNTVKKTLENAVKRGANLREAELQNAKFYGKGGTTKIKKSQVNDLFNALGIIVE